MFGLGFLKDMLRLRKLVYRCDICGRRRLRSEGEPVVLKQGSRYCAEMIVDVYGTYCPCCARRIAEKWEEMKAEGEVTAE